MKILFLEVVNKSKNSIDAHVRNCFELIKYLKSKGHKVDLLYNDTADNYKDKDNDVIIVSYASFYCNFKDMKRVIEENKNAKIYWLTNEYDLMPNGSLYKVFKERNAEVIANYEEKANKIKCFTKHHELNLNLLLYKRKKSCNKKYKILYYGTYRKDRAKYFKKYINSKDFYLSTSSKNFKKFESIGCKFRPIGKMKWGENQDTLGLFKYSLYIEDEYTHNNFNNLANRFYEALSNDTVILFDENCRNTLSKSEIKDFDYERFIIKDINEDRNYKEDLEEQSKWKKVVEENRRLMLEQFEKIIGG